MVKRFFAGALLALCVTVLPGRAQAAGETVRLDVPAEDGLALSWQCTPEPDGDGAMESLLVQFWYRWEVMPLCRWRDDVAVFWDGDAYAMEEGSFYKADLYDCVLLDGDGMPIATYTHQLKEEGGDCEAEAGSVRWRADIPEMGTVVISSSYGFGSFRLAPVGEGAAGPLSLRGEYVHRMVKPLGLVQGWQSAVSVVW